jgi:predicted metal-binding protein
VIKDPCILKDDVSGYSSIYLLKQKSETAEQKETQNEKKTKKKAFLVLFTFSLSLVVK